MAVFTLSSFRCRIQSDISAVSGEQPKEAVELRLRCFSRQFPRCPSGALVQQVLEDETTFTDQPIQVATDVCPLTLHEFKADPAKYQTHLEAELDGIKLNWMVAETKGEGDEDRAKNEKSEICSICLDELNGGKREEVEVGCGHVFHSLCIHSWLIDNNTCPLCRASLDFQR